MACVAFASVCHQHLPSRPWVVLVAASLVITESLHYLAVFAMIPFRIAEGLRALRKREVRLSAWLGLVAGVLPLAVFWPLISSYRAYYGSDVVLSSPPGEREPMSLDSVEATNERASWESGWATGRGEYGRAAKIFIAALCVYVVLRDYGERYPDRSGLTNCSPLR